MTAANFIHPVRRIDGIYHIENSRRQLVPIRNKGGAPIGPPGTHDDSWQPQLVYSGFAPVHLLEWQHPNGSRAGWYLDAQMAHLGDTPADLPPDSQSILRQRADAISFNIWQLLCAAEPRLNERARAFFYLNRAARSAILALAPPVELSLRELEPLRSATRPLPMFNGSRMVDLQPRLMLAALEDESTIIEKAISGLPTGCLAWPSPVDGRMLTTDAGLCLDDFRFAYRLVDAAHHLVFYVVAADQRCTSMALLFPASRQLFCRSEEAYEEAIQSETPLAQHLMRHLCEYGELLEGYLTADKRTLTAFFRERHHGHLLWNELSGIENLVDTVPPAFLPEVIIPSPTSQGSIEVYGKLETLYPEFAGKVDRSMADMNDLPRQAYRQRRCIMRPTTLLVSRRLGERILEKNLSGPGLEPEHKQLDSIAARGWPLVLLDVRLENRTIIDIAGFYRRLIDFIVDETGGAAIVLAGHTGDYMSPLALTAAKPVLDTYAETAAELTRRPPRPGLELINVIGAGMRRTLFWCRHAHFTIGICF